MTWAIDVFEDRRAWLRVATRLASSILLAALAIEATRVLAIRMGGAYFVALFPAVAGASLLGGTQCGLLTAALSVAAFSYEFLAPIASLAVPGSATQYRALGLLGSAAIVALLGGGFRRGYRKTREARHRAEAAEREALRLAQTQERLTAILGHDLRTPLSAIRLGADSLRRGSMPPAQLRTIHRIASSADRMGGMIQDLLDVARLRQGLGIAVAAEVVRLDDVCARAVDELRHAHPGRPIELEASAPLRVTGDASRLHQVVTNLVANAVQHGSAEDAVIVEARPDLAGERAVLRVHNRGAPIPPDLLPHVFDPFRRGSAAAARPSHGGLGLGLFIVHEIVKAHRGAATVTSSPHDGTTFTVSLPLAAAPQPARTSGYSKA